MTVNIDVLRETVNRFSTIETICDYTRHGILFQDAARDLLEEYQQTGKLDSVEHASWLLEIANNLKHYANEWSRREFIDENGVSRKYEKNTFKPKGIIWSAHIVFDTLSKMKNCWHKGINDYTIEKIQRYLKGNDWDKGRRLVDALDKMLKGLIRREFANIAKSQKKIVNSDLFSGKVMSSKLITKKGEVIDAFDNDNDNRLARRAKKKILHSLDKKMKKEPLSSLKKTVQETAPSDNSSLQKLDAENENLNVYEDVYLPPEEGLESGESYQSLIDYVHNKHTDYRNSAKGHNSKRLQYIAAADTESYTEKQAYQIHEGTVSRYTDYHKIGRNMYKSIGFFDDDGLFHPNQYATKAEIVAWTAYGRREDGSPQITSNTVIETIWGVEKKENAKIYDEGNGRTSKEIVILSNTQARLYAFMFAILDWEKLGERNEAGELSDKEYVVKPEWRNENFFENFLEVCSRCYIVMFHNAFHDFQLLIDDGLRQTDKYVIATRTHDDEDEEDPSNYYRVDNRYMQKPWAETLIIVDLFRNKGKFYKAALTVIKTDGLIHAGGNDKIKKFLMKCADLGKYTNGIHRNKKSGRYPDVFEQWFEKNKEEIGYDIDELVMPSGCLAKQLIWCDGYNWIAWNLKNKEGETLSDDELFMQRLKDPAKPDFLFSLKQPELDIKGNPTGKPLEGTSDSFAMGKFAEYTSSVQDTLNIWHGTLLSLSESLANKEEGLTFMREHKTTYDYDKERPVPYKPTPDEEAYWLEDIWRLKVLIRALKSMRFGKLTGASIAWTFQAMIMNEHCMTQKGFMLGIDGKFKELKGDFLYEVANSYIKGNIDWLLPPSTKYNHHTRLSNVINVQKSTADKLVYYTIAELMKLGNSGGEIYNQIYRGVHEALTANFVGVSDITSAYPNEERNGSLRPTHLCWEWNDPEPCTIQDYWKWRKWIAKENAKHDAEGWGYVAFYAVRLIGVLKKNVAANLSNKLSREYDKEGITKRLRVFDGTFPVVGSDRIIDYNVDNFDPAYPIDVEILYCAIYHAVKSPLKPYYDYIYRLKEAAENMSDEDKAALAAEKDLVKRAELKKHIKGLMKAMKNAMKILLNSGYGRYSMVIESYDYPTYFRPYRSDKDPDAGMRYGTKFAVEDRYTCMNLISGATLTDNVRLRICKWVNAMNDYASAHPDGIVKRAVYSDTDSIFIEFNVDGIAIGDIKGVIDRKFKEIMGDEYEMNEAKVFGKFMLDKLIFNFVMGRAKTYMGVMFSFNEENGEWEFNPFAVFAGYNGDLADKVIEKFGVEYYDPNIEGYHHKPLSTLEDAISVLPKMTSGKPYEIGTVVKRTGIGVFKPGVQYGQATNAGIDMFDYGSEAEKLRMWSLVRELSPVEAEYVRRMNYAENL